MSDLSLEDVSIDGFRGLRNLELQQLGQINLLVGGNNSGKTSALEAISVLCNAFEPMEWLSMIRRRDFGGLDETRVQSLRWCFRHSGEPTDPEYVFESACDIRCEGRFSIRRLHAKYRDVVGIPDEKELERMLRRSGRSRERLDFDEPWRGGEISHYLYSGNDLTNQTGLFESLPDANKEPIVATVWENDWMVGRPHRARRRGNLRNDTLTPYSYQLNRIQVRAHSQQLFGDKSIEDRRKDRVIEIIREFDPRIRDIQLASFRGDRPSLYVVHEVLGACPLSIFGDALRRAVLLASTLDELKGGGILLVDEVETGIHIDSLQRVFPWLVRTAEALKVQIIATTHSLEAVDAILRATGDEKDDIVIFHVEQQDHATLAKRMGRDLLVRLRNERGLDVR